MVKIWNPVTDAYDDLPEDPFATESYVDTVESDLATAVADGDASTLTSAQTYADGKVDDTAYGPGWNGDTTDAPSKNAVYDKLEAAIAALQPLMLIDEEIL